MMLSSSNRRLSGAVWKIAVGGVNDYQVKGVKVPRNLANHWGLPVNEYTGKLDLLIHTPKNMQAFLFTKEELHVDCWLTAEAVCWCRSVRPLWARR